MPNQFRRNLKVKFTECHHPTFNERARLFLVWLAPGELLPRPLSTYIGGRGLRLVFNNPKNN